ncbi:NLI interacting factor-like phosphatase [Leishmania donovani]|nr:NLI interacting factor-like phosphatase family protein [Leishmania donovani]CAJ1989103.1 NLI interacting factor-like phosphatase [Leishmania donovani]
MTTPIHRRASSSSPDRLPPAPLPSSLSTIRRVWNDRLRAFSSARDVASVGEPEDVVSGTPKVKDEARLRQVAVASSGGGRLEAASGVDDGLTDSPAATVRTRSSSLYPTRTSSKRRTVVRFKDATPVNPHTSAVVAARHPVDPNAGDMVGLVKPLFPNTLLTEAQDERRLLTLVLDLDETLVSNRDSRQSAAVLRPYCLHVLNALRHMKELEIVLWTASTKETALPVVDQLHKTGIIFDDIIFRNSIWFTQPIHTKDLRLLGRDMNRVLIVDNSVGCCKLHPRNALLVEDFHGVRRREDAALVNVYYVVDALLRMMRERSIPVSEGLGRLMAEGQLCHPVSYDLPEFFKYIPLTEVPELKRPPVGCFVRANTAPPNTSIMQHWVY